MSCCSDKKLVDVFQKGRVAQRLDFGILNFQRRKDLIIFEQYLGTLVIVAPVGYYSAVYYLQTQLSCSSVQYSSTNDFETEMTVESGHSILKSTKGLRPRTFLQLFPWTFGLVTCSSHVYEY